MDTICPTRRHLLPALALAPACLCTCLPAWSRARTPPPLILAQEAPDGIEPASYLVSEKLDGVRAHWDGTELRSRSGLPIAAPGWFTARLPAAPLDGELWLGRGRFEALSAAVRRQRAVDAEWRALRYCVFELPGWGGSFSERAERIVSLLGATGFDGVRPVPQQTLPDRAALQRRLDDVVRGGGEGLMLHRADAPYVSGRSPLLLKLKPEQDDEALVLGHVAGRGRHAGRLGALRVRTGQGVEFLLGTGLSDAQRDRPPAIGAVVSFRYRGLTAAGVPRFASFMRLHEV